LQLLKTGLEVSFAFFQQTQSFDGQLCVFDTSSSFNSINVCCFLAVSMEETSNMKTLLRVLGGPLCIGLLMLFALTPAANASTTSSSPLLPKSPLSGGLQMAMAIHSGKIHIPAQHSSAPSNPNLTCTPAPCVLPNVQASGGNGSQPVNEDPIAANPKNGQDLMTGGNDYNCVSLQGFYTSSDGGTTWKSTCMNLLSGAYGDGDPGVGYDLKGNSYISGIDGGTSDGYDIAFEKSSNNGKTWSAPAIAVHNGISGGLTDKDWLAVDDSATSKYANAVYISITQFNASQSQTQITVTHSDNGGTTWTTVPVEALQPAGTVDQFSDLTIGKDGSVYVTWMRCSATGPRGDCGDTTASFYISKSSDGGNTWSTPLKFASATLVPDSCGYGYYGCLPNTNERVSDIPAVGVSTFKKSLNHLHVAFYTWTGTYMKVEVTSSSNGTKWNTPVAVAPKTDTHDQFFAWLSVSKKGQVGVTWMDRRNDPNNLLYEEYGAVSKTGSSFSTNYQIASQPSNPDNDGFSGGFMGDYTGNVWAGEHLYASWMDTRNGSNCQDYVGGILQ
jgi:hypothetical protein